MVVNQCTSLDWALVRIRNYATAHGKLQRLLVVCPGYEELGIEHVRQVSVRVGGFGLKLCKDGLADDNVKSMKILNCHVDNIIDYACAKETVVD